MKPWIYDKTAVKGPRMRTGSDGGEVNSRLLSVDVTKMLRGVEYCCHNHLQSQRLRFWD
jgi:hypothetical protein